MKLPLPARTVISSKSVLLALLAAVILSPAAHAEKKRLEPIKTWSGSQDGNAPQPGSGCVADAKALAKLWAEWKIAEPLPEVDFSKDVVVFATTVGSRINLMATLDEKGDLAIGGMATRDLRPGFRYTIATVPRAGVLTCNGQPVPAP